MKVIYTDDSRGFAVRFNSSRKAWTRLGMISNGSNFGWMTGFPTQVGYEFICIGSETPGTERKKNRPWTQLWAHELLACFCGFPNLQRLGRLQVEASQRLSKVQASDSYFVALNLLMVAGFLCAFLFKWPVKQQVVTTSSVFSKPDGGLAVPLWLYVMKPLSGSCSTPR